MTRDRNAPDPLDVLGLSFLFHGKLSHIQVLFDGTLDRVLQRGRVECVQLDR